MNEQTTIETRTLHAMLRLLQSSWFSLNYDYNGLTNEEKDCINRDEFEKVIQLMQDNGVEV